MSSTTNNNNNKNSEQTKVATPVMPPKPSPVVQDAQTEEHVPAVDVKSPGHHYLVCMDLDDQECSKKAIAYARDRLCTEGDTVVLLVVVPISLYSSSAFMMPSLYSMEDDREYAKAIQKRALDRLRAEAHGWPKGVTVRIHLRHGIPSDEIIESAKYHKSDMIIVGRRKLGFMQRLVSSGSVSNALLSHFEGSLMVVR